jgi:hypothetical protein
MKRLLGLAVIFLVLSVCVPSYGYFLIYNVSGSVKGVNNELAASIPWKAYLVVNLDSNDEFVDANLVMYGKDSTKKSVYVQLNYSDGAHSLDIDISNKGSGFIAIDLRTDVNTPLNYEALIIGKTKLTDVGLADKKLVPSSLTGTMIVRNDMFFAATDNLTGTGTVSATLYAKATKAVNTYGLTQDEIIVSGFSGYPGMLQTLTDKGFSAAILTE